MILANRINRFKANKPQQLLARQGNSSAVREAIFFYIGDGDNYVLFSPLRKSSSF